MKLGYGTLAVLLLSISNSVTVNAASTVAPSSAASTVVTPTAATAAATATAATTGGRGNPVGQLAGYVKDSFVRMKDGSVQLYTNHKRCNTIRSKQREYLSTMAASLPLEAQKAAKRYTMNAGGIDYEEFNFLQKGKDDRSKLANIVFMMFFTPNFVPYAFMFFPEMLPSPFVPMPSSGSAANNNKMGLPYTKFDQISRERTHAVISTLMQLERAARVAPMTSNLNPFGKGRTRRMMERMESYGHQVGTLLVMPPTENQRVGNIDGTSATANVIAAGQVLKVFEGDIYSEVKPKNKVAYLSSLPKYVMKGLGRAMEAPSFNSILPAFFVRGKVLNNIKQIELSDQFLVNQNINLKSLNVDLLQDACNARLIGNPGSSSQEEMVEGLAAWLELVVKQPQVVVGKTGKHYNGNMARAALLCYNAIDGARDGRSASYLPRLMYQGQQCFQSNTNSASSIEGTERKRRFK